MEMRQRYNLPRVSGLIRPFPDQTSGVLNRALTLNDVNSDVYRQQIITNCQFGSKNSSSLHSTEKSVSDRLQGTGEPGSDQNMAGTLMQNMPIDNMFTTSRDDEKQFDVFPEAQSRSSPVYKTAAQWQTLLFFFRLQAD